MLHYLPVPLAVLLSLIAIKTTHNYFATQKIEAIEVRDSNLMSGESFYRVYYDGPFVMYQSHYTHSSHIMQDMPDTTSNKITIDSSGVWSQKRDLFFVFHKDSSYCYSYDVYGDPYYNRRMLVDSAFHMFKGENNSEALLSKTPDSTNWNQGKTELREVYVCKGNKDTPTVRVVMYYSSALNHLKESMNPVMDSAKKMKLYKTEFFINEIYIEKDKTLWPAWKWVKEMKEISVENPEVVNDYIERYKRSVGIVK